MSAADFNPTLAYPRREPREWTDQEIVSVIHTVAEQYAPASGDEERRAVIELHWPKGLTWKRMFEVCLCHPDTRLGSELHYLAKSEIARLAAHREYIAQELRDVNAQLDSMGTKVSHNTETSKARVLADRRLPRAIDETRLPRLMDMVHEQAIGKPIAKVLVDIMEAHFSQVFNRFYPRHYDEVGGYHSPKECAAFLANVTAETIRYGFDRAPTAYRLMLPSFTYMIERRMPYFFLAPDLLKAIMATDFDQDIDWTTLKLPYESGVFILPRKGFSHPQDGEVSMILWTRTPPGTYVPPVAIGIPQIEITSHNLSILALCPDKAIWYDAVLNAEVRPIMRIRNLFYRQEGEEIPHSNRNVPYLDEDLTEEDSAFLEQVGLIAFGTFMALNARPELLEEGKLQNVVKAKGDRPRREFWSPNVIGKRYKLRREVPKIVDGHFVYTKREHGTHASPRMHWRRGHFREQPYGPQRKLRKQIWLEPTLISAQTEET